MFRDLMSEKLPRLHAHLEQHKVDFSLITFNWFLVAFVDSVVSDILFKIWDAFLYEGPKVRVAAAHHSLTGSDTRRMYGQPLLLKKLTRVFGLIACQEN